MEENLTIREQIELLEKLTQNKIEYRLSGKPKTEDDFIREIIDRRQPDTMNQHYLMHHYSYK